MGRADAILTAAMHKPEAVPLSIDGILSVHQFQQMRAVNCEVLQAGQPLAIPAPWTEERRELITVLEVMLTPTSISRLLLLLLGRLFVSITLAHIGPSDSLHGLQFNGRFTHQAGSRG